MLKSTKNGLASRVLGADQIPNKNILVTQDAIVMTEDRPASATSAGVVSTGAQSFAGDKTFTGQATFAGGTVGVTATATNTEINVVAFPSSVGSGGGVWSETGTVFDSGLSTTSTAGDLPLAGITSTAIKMIANASGAVTSDYVSTTLTMPATLLNRKLKVDIWMRPGTGFASSEWTVSVYSGSTRMSLSTDSSGVTYLPNATGKFVTTFDADSSATYTLRFARVSGSGSATLNVCNVIVGPGIQPQGAVVEEWKSYTPTFSAGFGTTSAVEFFYRRVGDSVDIQGRFASTSPVASEGRIGLPSGLTIGAISTHVVGRWMSSNTTNTLPKGGPILGYVGYNYVGWSADHVTSTENAFTFRNGSAFIDSGNTVSLWCRLPIAEWAGSGTVNVAQNDVEYASNNGSEGTVADRAYNTGMVYGPTGSNFVDVASNSLATSTKYRVRFQSPIQQTDKIEIEIWDTVGAWVPLEQFYYDPIRPYQNQANANYGMGWARTTTATDIYVAFGNYGSSPDTASGAAYAGLGRGWGNWTTYKWRVRKTSAGAAVGFGNHVPGVSAGLVPAQGLDGRTDGVVVPVGKVGQLIQDVETTGVAASVSGQYFDVGSIALTAGEWEIDWYVLMYNNGSSGFTEGIMGVSTATGNSSQDMVKGITQHDHYKTASVVSLSTSGSVRCRVSSTQITLLTTSTPSGTARTGNTLYLKAYANDITGGPPVAYGYIKATRA